ncbi:MAG: ribonuclease H-like domain-containing protein [Candidatus Omnitrophica bacterium]|nr:ribonuclease H-like domain-containing protein [Candidatus Omnitrophota bacterium]
MYQGKRVIVLDIETQKGFHEVDRSKLHQLKISVVGIYDSYDDQYLCFEEHQLGQLEARLKLCDLLVGFNINGFDMKVLGPHLLMDVRKIRVLDIMDEIAKVRGHRVSLQSVAQATLNDQKSGSGWDAIQLYKDGRMEDLKRYCLDDVRITRKAFDYGLEHKKLLFFSNRDFTNHEVAIDFSPHLTGSDEADEAVFPTSLF